MYSHQEERSIEKICYEQEHTRKVVEAIKKKFEDYFDDFIKLEAGHGISEETAKKIGNGIGVTNIRIKKCNDITKKFKNIIIESIDDFEKDREKYKAIFDKEALEEYEDDPPYFKSTVLKNECPIIHSTIHNKRAKELDKYRRDFSISNANDLLVVVTNLCNFGEEYYDDFYEKDTYDQIQDYKDLNLEALDTEDYIVYGVIGGGIKSHMIYKVFPAVFSNRSRSALWAMWYLTNKSKFECEQDSEFLMIDIEKSITQQNYFYPYELFSYYAFQIYLLLKEKADENDVYIDPEYRYVIVDVFLSFIASQHDEEISLLKSNIKDGGYGYF